MREIFQVSNLISNLILDAYNFNFFMLATSSKQQKFL